MNPSNIPLYYSVPLKTMQSVVNTGKNFFKNLIKFTDVTEASDDLGLHLDITLAAKRIHQLQ